MLSDRLLRSFLRGLLERASCAELRAGEKNQSRDVGPEQQANGYVKRSVERLQVHVRQHGYEAFFRNQPDDTGDNRSAYDLPGRNFPVGQQPVDRKEEQNGRDTRRRRQPKVADPIENKILSVMEEDKAQKLALPCAEQDTPKQIGRASCRERVCAIV